MEIEAKVQTPTGEVIVQMHNPGTEYYVLNGKEILPRHNFINEMDIQRIHLNNISVAFFKLVHSLCGDKMIERIARESRRNVVFELTLPEEKDPSDPNNIGPKMMRTFSLEANKLELRSKHLDQYLYETGRKLAKRTTHHEECWHTLWSTMDYLHSECDIINTIAYYGGAYDVMLYLFKLADKHEIQLYLSCRIVEKLSDYYHECKKWKTKRLGMRYCVKRRREIPRALQTLFLFRKNGLNLPHPDQDSGQTCYNFVLHGKFTQFPDVPASVLPFCDAPHDGLFMRLYLTFYLVSYNAMLSGSVRAQITSDLKTIYSDLDKQFDILRTIVRAFELPEKHYLRLMQMKPAFNDINDCFKKIYATIYRESISNAVSQISNDVYVASEKHNIPLDKPFVFRPPIMPIHQENAQEDAQAEEFNVAEEVQKNMSLILSRDASHMMGGGGGGGGTITMTPDVVPNPPPTTYFGCSNGQEEEEDMEM